MATVPISTTDQEIPPAHDLGEREPREETEARQAPETDSAVRDAHEERQTPEILAPAEDNAPQAGNEAIQPQETTKALVDVMLNDCRVEMVPLDDIYAGSEPQDEE